MIRFRFIVVSVLFSCQVIASSPWLSRLAQSPSRAVLEPAYRHALNAGGRDETLLLFEYLLGEISSLEGRIHEADEYFSKVLARCEKKLENKFSGDDEATKSRAGYVCAFATSERQAPRWPWSAWSFAHRLSEFVRVARLGVLVGEEREYLEARLGISLAPLFGRNLKKSLVALAFLERQRPDLASVHFLRGKAYLYLGNMSAADESFQTGLKSRPIDTRTVLWLRSQESLQGRYALDSRSWGLTPSIAFGPVQDLLGSLVWKDDALFDARRSAAVEVAASLRGSWMARGRFTDEATLDEFGFHVEASGRRWVSEFFGLGSETRLSDRSVLTETHAELKAWVFRVLPLHFVLGVGWRVAKANLDASLGPQAPPAPYGRHMGPLLQFSWDNRLSRILTRSGGRISGEVYFPTVGLGSQHQFETWRLEAEYTLTPMTRHAVDVHAGVRWLPGSPVFSEYSQLVGSFEVPGVRAGRFRERDLGTVWARYRYFGWAGFSPGLFAVVATLGNKSPFEGRPRWGGGISFEIDAGSSRPSASIELGRFADETVLQAGISQSF